MKLIQNWSFLSLIFISTSILVNRQDTIPHIILIMIDQQRGDAVGYNDKYDLDSPLILKISCARPHSPYEPLQRFLDQNENVAITRPAIGDWA